MAGLPQALRAAGSVLVQVLGWTPSFEPQHAFGLVEKSLGHSTGHIFLLLSLHLRLHLSVSGLLLVFLSMYH